MSDHHASGEGGSLGRAELLASFVPGCDPLNATDLSQIARKLEDLRITLRGEGADLEDALCGLAERILLVVAGLVVLAVALAGALLLRGQAFRANWIFDDDTMLDYELSLLDESAARRHSG